MLAAMHMRPVTNPCMRVVTKLAVCCAYRVTVGAGITTDLNGNPNSAASQVVKYRPPSTAVSAVSYTANAVMGATIGASLLTGLLSGNACHALKLHSPVFCISMCSTMLIAS